MKLLLIALLSVVTVVSSFAPTRQISIASEINQPIDFDRNFQDATDTIMKLLLPNSMARTKVRSGKEVKALLQKFKRIAATFTKNPEVTVPFLAEKIKISDTNDNDAAICALQLLYEINTPTSRKIIQNAQSNPDEVVARIAKEMIREKVDVLYGFSKKGSHNHRVLR